MEKIKKIISVMLILILTMTPFLSMLNVKAEDSETFTITTYGENEEGINPNLVTNKANLIVNGVTNGDELSAYKIIDIFYDKNTNEMTYDFTNDFKTFLAQSTNDTYKNMKIEDYFNLTSDNEDGTTSESVITASTLNILVSQYTTYISSNDIKSNVDMTTTGSTSSAKVVAGAYLVLPTKVNTQYGIYDGQDLGSRPTATINMYGVMVANIVFDSVNGVWVLNNREIHAKRSNNHFDTMLLGFSASQYTNFINGIPEDVSLYFQQDISSYRNKKNLYTLELWGGTFKFPTNAIDKQATFTIEIPDGIDYDQEHIYTINNFGEQFTEIINGEIVVNDTIIAKINTEEKKVTIEIIKEDENFILCFDVWTNNNAAVGPSGNAIKSTLTIPENPYVDGSISEIEITNTIYTYGLELTSFNNDNTTLLKGAKYEVYSKEDLSSNSLIGEFEVGEDGTGTFAGVAEGTVYLKQTKAPTGYQLIKEVIPVKIATEDATDTDNDYYYEVSTSNQKMWFLPSTGGMGTIIYTVVGLVIIGIAGVALVKYRKKTVNM